MSERMDGWRECADPVELAAAVAAGVEVQRNWGYDWQPGTNNETAEQFAGCTKANCRYRVPASWSWSPEPPTDVPTGAERYLAERLADPEYRAAYEAAAPAAGDDLRERIARAAACAYMRVPVEAMDPRIIIEPMWPEVADAVLAVLPPLPAPPPVPPWPGAVLSGLDRWEDDCHGCGFRVGDHTTDGRCPAPATPVPPWPGAVLSGLVDEDGVPTWLAQAGQVRGEQVRRRSDLVWVNNDQMVAHLDTVWVEVRAPRAVPEPETERVPWWEARDRLGLAGDPFVEVGSDDEGPWVRVVEGGTKLHSPVDPDGTVEVLRQDGDR